MSGKRLEGKIAIVTGCGSSAPGWGNGKATAVLFAREGATVVGIDLNLDAALETQRIIEGEGGRAFVSAGNVLDAEQVKSFVDDCVKRFERIDILVNNVGGSAAGGPVELDEETWQAQLDINMKSAFLTCKFVLPVMEAQGQGAVVNTSSISGLRNTGKNQVAYAAAKAGLIQFTRATAVMYAPKGVRLNSVVPGLIHTGVMHRHAEKYSIDYEELLARRRAAVPMKCMGDAWDIAYATLFLASPEAKYITAAEIVVDGGITSVVGLSYA